MKNQYFGDINDYRKYGILRALTGAGLSIGVCWLLTPDDGRGDGEFRKYLTEASHWRGFDPELYENLQRLQQSSVQRSVQLADEWKLVPGATYFGDVLPEKGDERDAYFNAALEAVRKCDVVFFDPDNGIEVQSTRRGKRGSGRYVYWSELREAFGNGHSLVVYQHFPRIERTYFVSSLVDCCAKELQTQRVMAFTTRYAAFFVVYQDGHRSALDEAAAVVRFTWQDQINLWPSMAAAINGNDHRCTRHQLLSSQAGSGLVANEEAS